MRISLRSLFILFLFINTALQAQDSRISISSGNLIADASHFSGSHFEMTQNSPNPFSAITDIAFFMPSQGFIEFKVVNLIGKEIVRQVMEVDPGRNSLRFDGSDFLPGVYVFSLSNGSQTLTRRMIISKK